jgi:hypothetical protein
MNKKIQIISATKTSLKETVKDKKELLLIAQSIDYIDATFHIKHDNSESLAKVYNKYITNEFKNDILVFCHDDAIIEDALLNKKLNDATEQFDIVGLAGIKAPITLKSPALWHLMGNPSQYSGAVAHFDKDGSRRFMTSFGPMPERVVLLDGVFLAINTERILEKGLQFDENNPAKFHFYDLNFSLDANKLGLKLGTWPIWCTHRSHGLENPTEEWKTGESYFLQKYS